MQSDIATELIQFILLENAAGERRVLPYPDAELTALDINEGDTIALTDHKLSKVK